MSVMTDNSLLQVRGLSKSFPGLKALNDVSLDVSAGEVVAIVGHNGSGKSTLVKILAGVYSADPGAEVLVREPDGEMVPVGEGSEYLHFIHQDLGLIPMLNTVESIDLGRDLGRKALMPADNRGERARAESLINRFGASFDVKAPISELSAAERTIVAIVRALDSWSHPESVLVLDEPTAALHGNEVDKLTSFVRQVAAERAGVIYISHRLDEVLGLADRIVVLRGGIVVTEARKGEIDHDGLVRAIAGREIDHDQLRQEVGPPAETAPSPSSPGAPMLRVRNLRGGTVRDVSFDVSPGEILGVTGLLGSGREHLTGLLFGALRPEGGEMEIDGKRFAPKSPSDSVARRVACVPADRHRDGAVMTMNVRENLTLPHLRPLRQPWASISSAREKKDVGAWLDAVGLLPPDPERELALFSGGNQQKVVLAKWLRIEPRVLLLDEPTQGVDVGAQNAIYELVVGAAAAGAAVVVSSSDAAELSLLCDRILVLRDGQSVAELNRGSITETKLVEATLGLHGSNGNAAQPHSDNS